MTDSIKSKVDSKKILMCYRGQEQIGAIWIPYELEVKQATFLRFFNVGEY